jgi:hypothetical protein
MRKTLVACVAALLFGTGAASDPAERLADPAAEARARSLFTGVRCVVCQNESIDDSDAELAADLRRIVREQVAAGRSDGGVRLPDGAVRRVRAAAADVLAANLPLWRTRSDCAGRLAIQCAAAPGAPRDGALRRGGAAAFARS